MDSQLLTALREAREALASAATPEPGAARVARALLRDIDAAVAELEGKEPETDLISIVCHDLKDPLASIVMGAGFLKKTLPPSREGDDGAVRRVAEAIARSANRMNQVVSDLHDVVKLEAAQLTIDVHECDVSAALRGAMEPLEAPARERNVTLRLEAPAEAIARCDRARLVQIVTKLVLNAIKFTPAGGSAVVRVEKGDSEQAAVRVSVSDTGSGIAPERLPTIFDRAANARRTPRDGPGMGLAIARGLVQLHGGTLGVESRVGEGSTFTFTLPRGGPGSMGALP